MADPVSWAVIGSAVLGAGTSVYATEEQKRQARIASGRQEDAIKAQKKELYAREEEENKIATRDAAKARQKAMGGAAGGRQSTILTSPLGVVEDEKKYGKTLLGA
jgi:hypothetical protein